jgi:transposase
MSSRISPARQACGLSEPLLQANAIPDVLATYRDVRCHSSIATIRAALVGNDRHEHVFALTQSLELYDIYQAKMLDCDRKLEVLIAALSNREAKPVGKLSKPRVKTKQVNTPTFDVRTALYGVLGVDLTEIHGLGPSLALKLVGECGKDLRAWPSAKHFTSWLCLAPGNKISGGKVLSSRTRRSSSRAAALLQQPSGGAIRRSVHSIADCRHVR